MMPIRTAQFFTTLFTANLDLEFNLRRRAREVDGFSHPHFEPLDFQAKVGFLAGMRLNSRKSRGIRSRHPGIHLAGRKEPAISGGITWWRAPPHMRPDINCPY
jgi:hypothetical protein